MFWKIAVLKFILSLHLHFHCKVQTFCEAHQNLRNLHHTLYIYLVNVQTMRKTFSDFVCFLESPTLWTKMRTLAKLSVEGLQKKITFTLSLLRYLAKMRNLPNATFSQNQKSRKPRTRTPGIPWILVTFMRF